MQHKIVWWNLVLVSNDAAQCAKKKSRLENNETEYVTK